MKKELPDINYERSMNHNYIVLSERSFFGSGNDSSHNYRVKMLLGNKIPGLLPVTHRQADGENKYYYEINSLQSLDRMFEKKEIKFYELKEIFLGCINLFESLEEYLLDGSQIIMKMEYIYVNVETMKPYFVCYPEYDSDVRLSFMEFVDVLLTKIDHTDQQAVMLGYQVYRYTRNPNYVLSEIQKFMVNVEMPDVENVGSINEENAKYISDNVGIKAGKCSYNKNRYEAENFCKEPYIDDNGYYSDETDEKSEEKRKGNIKELIGGVFCVFVALCAGTVIVGAKVLASFKLSADNELYLYGAMAMALVAAALFFSCYLKTRKQDMDIEQLNDTEDEDDIYNQLIKENLADESNKPVCQSKVQSPSKQMFNQQNDCTETVCLGDEAMEERILRGRVNGREVNMPLDKLPMTVGKLWGVSDFIINDTTVSKMHAKFEERDGKIYLSDLNSTNGTVKNGESIGINNPVALEPGDTIRFGRSLFTYC